MQKYITVMRFLILILLFSTGLSVYSQKVIGKYSCYLGNISPDLIRCEKLFFDFKKDNTFALLKIDCFTEDTSVVSNGKFYKKADTISFLTLLPNFSKVFFYPSDLIDSSVIKISFYYGAMGWNLPNEIKSYSFYTFDDQLRKDKIVPYDTFPDYSNSLKVFHGENYDSYISYFFKKKELKKYMMLCKETKYWNEHYNGLEESNTITFVISNLKERSICVRKDKYINGNFCRFDFVDFTNTQFILKRDTLLPLKSIDREGYLKFIKE